MNILGLIPARSGSKRLPGKNIKPLAGKPLLSWTIEAALESQYVTRVAVSTDNEEIKKVALASGADVPFMRPAHLSDDTALRNQVVEHALQNLSGFDVVVLLQPTSPLRRACHIDEALKMMLAKSAPSCVSICQAYPPPNWMFEMSNEGNLQPILGSWDFKPFNPKACSYTLNGAIFICATDEFSKCEHPDPFITPNTVGYEMSSEESVDIDTEIDFRACEMLME